MKLVKIIIQNFKSIDNMELNITKYGKSYTTMFVGINEVGKSNILEALSYFMAPTETVYFSDFNNRNYKDKNYVDIYFDMEFENKKTYIDELKLEMNLSDKFISNFKITNVSKNIYLEKDSDTFQTNYSFDIESPIPEYYHSSAPKMEIKHKTELTASEAEQFVKFDQDSFSDILNPILVEIVKKYEFHLTFWKPDKQYLITEPIDLNVFKDNPNINIPLKNIFALCGYKQKDEIKAKVEEINRDIGLRRGLASELTKNATTYFGNVWEHKIEIDVEISENLRCNVHVKDKGKYNATKYYNMNSRSQGFHQFMSLILSLSIQNHSLDMKNQLILIDEPENHLHPSGIRDMAQQLLTIGENNYVFLATHSCFMIDKGNKERNYIIKKDAKQNTSYLQITEDKNIFDDEVLSDAFGINVYKDFMIPNRLLVEGASDRTILTKAIEKMKITTEIGITNGYGSNIVSVASRLNLEKINSLVILDDDSTGKMNKERIIKIGGIYSATNVMTIRDHVPEIIDGGTIEDTLGTEFVQSCLDKYWAEKFEGNHNTLTLDNNKPLIKQIKDHMNGNIPKNDIDEVIKDLKLKISEDFNPSNIDSNFPLLKSLVEKIESKYKEG